MELEPGKKKSQSSNSKKNCGRHLIAQAVPFSGFSRACFQRQPQKREFFLELYPEGWALEVWYPVFAIRILVLY